ncbi:hypothetical protein H632_c179p0, partial [Helicosporidium sp. ATCC 50920]
MIERLPQNVAIDILAKAYLWGEPEGSGFWMAYDGCNPFRMVVPLVCKRWYQLVKTPAAAQLFFKRLRVVDSCISPKARFHSGALLRWFRERAEYVQELEVDLTDIFSSSQMVTEVTAAVVEMIAVARSLRVLRLSGRLSLGAIFRGLETSVAR